MPPRSRSWKPTAIVHRAGVIVLLLADGDLRDAIEEAKEGLQEILILLRGVQQDRL